MGIDFEKFVDGYIEAALWADCMPAEEDGEMGGGEDLILRDGAREAMIERGQLRDFVDAYEADLAEYVVERGVPMDWAGHDFWLTRNGHGAGFWDRGLGALGDRLTAAAKTYGSADDHTPFDCGDGTADV